MSAQPSPRALVCAGCGAPLEPGGPRLVCAHCGTFQELPLEGDSSGQDGDACVRRGVEAFNREDYHFALRELETALTLPIRRYQPAEVMTILGNACDNLGLYTAALAWYRRALQVDADFYKAWVAMGVTFRHSGDLAEAERCYREALRIEPEYAELHASLGALYVVRGEVKAAVAALEKAVRINPGVASAHGNLALAYAMDGQFDKADRSLRQAVALGYKSHAAIRERIAALKGLN
jgi:Flp pilus assembly protein TadD